MLVDLDAVTAILRDVVDTEVLPRFRNLTEQDIRAKTGPDDLVTEADIQAEIQLTARLADLLPGSVVVGEEAVHADPSVLNRLSGESPVWVIDPVDGTANFSRGDPVFGCILALVHKGRTVAGWIDHCVERSTTVAELGGGCYRDGTRLTITARPDKPMASLTGCAGGRPLLTTLAPKVAKVGRVGSAAHAYLALVSQRADFAVFTRLKPWDHAAGIMMHAEAGGYSALLDGRPYAPTMREGTPLMASDAESWERLAAVLTAFR